MNPRARVGIPVALAVVVVATLAWIWFHGRGQAGTLEASGTVEATEAQLGFQVSGRIDSVLVHEGDAVRAGQVLARLDTVEAGSRRQQALAEAAAARAGLLELERGSRAEEVAQARAADAAAKQRLADAQRDFDRAQHLLKSGAVSQEAFDKAQLALDVAQAQQVQADEQRRLVEAGPRQERIQAQRAQVAQAEAAVQTWNASLANMTIRAPFDGVVTVRDREPGEIVAPGAAVVTVMNPDDRWVRIYVPERHVGTVALGTAARIGSDSYPGKVYRGRVIYVAPQAEFTPKSVQTKEERVKLVYAVKVQVAEDPELQLKPGMPADVRLEIARP